MHIAVTIQVDGSPLPLNLRRLHWTQSLYGYDRFEIVVADPDLAPGSGSVRDLTTELAAHLGKSLAAEFETRSGQLPLHLQGIVTAVRGRYQRRGVEVVLEGVGAAHLLDRVVHTRLFVDQTWKEIVDQVIQGASGKLAASTIDLGSWASVKVPFCCQYHETDFAFLRRLCATWGWILCAGGNDLQVVSAEKFSGFRGYDTLVELVPGSNCLTVEAAIHAVPSSYEASNYQYYGERGLKDHNYGDEETKTWSCQPQATGQGHAGSGISGGTALFTTPGSSHDGGIHWGQKEADLQAARWTAHAVGGAASFGGRTWAPGIRLGRKVKISSEADLSVDWVNGETALVTEVEHLIVGVDYSNRFVGCALNAPILADPAAYPPRDRWITLPATVSKSDDPSRVGRIRVKPLILSPSWMPETIPVRLTARSAGADHGELLQPEVGDEVLLGFHPDSFEEPIVTSVMYNGSKKTLPDKLPAHTRLQQAQIDRNDLKWFLTRGGNALIMDDTAGSERILVVTKTGSLELSEESSGPHMSLTVRDGQDPKCVLTFDKQGQVTLKAKNVLFDIEEKIEFKCGKEHTVDAQGKIDLKTAVDYLLDAGAKIDMKSATDSKLEAGTKVSVKSGTDTEIKAGMNAKLEGGMNTTVKGAMQLKAEGGMQAELKGGAMVTIQGGIVKIN